MSACATRPFAVSGNLSSPTTTIDAVSVVRWRPRAGSPPPTQNLRPASGARRAREWRFLPQWTARARAAVRRGHHQAEAIQQLYSATGAGPAAQRAAVPRLGVAWLEHRLTVLVEPAVRYRAHNRLPLPTPGVPRSGAFRRMDRRRPRGGAVRRPARASGATSHAPYQRARISKSRGPLHRVIRRTSDPRRPRPRPARIGRH
jgi:hypothetical protein